MILASLKEYLLCVAVSAAAFFSTGCEKDQNQTEWWHGEQERIGLGHQLELQKYRFAQAYTHGFEELEELRNATELAASSLHSLRQQCSSLSEEVASMEGKWDGFRESTIRNQRHRAIGKTFESVHLISGRKFQDVTISAIDDAGVTIRHTDGSARLRFADLDSDQRLFFGLEEDLALVAVEKEAAAVASYERWIDDRMVIIHEQGRTDSESVRREELIARQERSQLAARQVEVWKKRPLAQAPTSVGSRSRWYSGSYSTYRTYRPTYRYVDSYSTANYNSNCRTFVSPQSFYPKSTWTSGTGYVSPSMVPKCNSFANTTLPFIP